MVGQDLLKGFLVLPLIAFKEALYHAFIIIVAIEDLDINGELPFRQLQVVVGYVLPKAL